MKRTHSVMDRIATGEERSDRLRGLGDYCHRVLEQDSLGGEALNRGRLGEATKGADMIATCGVDQNP